MCFWYVLLIPRTLLPFLDDVDKRRKTAISKRQALFKRTISVNSVGSEPTFMA